MFRSARGAILGVGICALFATSAQAQSRPVGASNAAGSGAAPASTTSTHSSAASSAAPSSTAPAASSTTTLPPASPKTPAAPGAGLGAGQSPKSGGTAKGVAAAPMPPTAVAPEIAPLPPSTTLTDAPDQPLSLDDALKAFHGHGFDLLIADANVRGAEADVRSAGFIPNPALQFAYGRVVDPQYNPSGGASGNSYAVGISDQAAIIDTLAGKRGLRKDVANAALAAARMSKVDAYRTLDFLVKQQYVSLAAAQSALEFAKTVQVATTKTLDLQKVRYPKVINEGELARFETTKLEADQSIDRAEQDLQTARVSLAFLLGERAVTPSYVADANLMKFELPPKLSSSTLADLERQAVTTRPDVQAQIHQEERAQASIDLARRQRFPDVALSAQYSQTGTGANAVSPPMLSIGVSAPIPLLYQNQGEIAHAEADLYAQSATRHKLEAGAVNDVASAYAAFSSSRRLVGRMENGLLERSKKARDITELQYNAGSTSLIDFIDAERTFIATNFEYIQDLTAYWTAVFQLEEAVGTDLRK
ncbi:MAG: TolC family protein [Polyangiaceae bacterium]